MNKNLEETKFNIGDMNFWRKSLSVQLEFYVLPFQIEPHKKTGKVSLFSMKWHRPSIQRGLTYFQLKNSLVMLPSEKFLSHTQLLWKMCLEIRDKQFCEYPRGTWNLTQFLQSDVSHERHCSLLVISNLAQPYSVNIHCESRLLSNIVCLKRYKESHQERVLPHLTRKLCDKKDIIFSSKCFFLLSVVHNDAFGRKFSAQSHLAAFCKQRNKSVFLMHKRFSETIFGRILVATSTTDMRAIVIENLHGKFEVIRYHRIWEKIISKHERNMLKPMQAWLSCCSPPQKNDTVETTGLHKCKNGRHISTAHLCDEEENCGDGSDEELCSCLMKQTPSFERNCSKPLCASSPFFQRNKEGSCKTFTNQGNSHVEDFRKTRNLNCSERALLFVSQKAYKVDNVLMCHDEEEQCFHPGDICVYRLVNNSLYPCQSGAHLQECGQFECNIEVKCPSFYCITWRHVCDGRWDCPFGFDESAQLECGTKTCFQMFACRNSDICIHILEHCDGIPDCPLGDDEHLCALSVVSCPEGCVCLNFAVFCVAISVDFKFWAEVFSSYTIHQSQFSDSKFALNSKFLRIANFSDNHIIQGCFEFYSTKQLLVFDVSKNMISTIPEHCYHSLKYIRLLQLRANTIVSLEAMAFSEINSTSLVIDLSRNYISALLKNTFHRVFHLIMLLLQDNDIITVDFSGVAVGLVFTRDFTVCCSTDSYCTAAKPWYRSCSKLFPSVSLSSMFVSIASCILALNVVNFGTNNFWKNARHKRQNRKVNNKPHASIISFINSGDFICGVYLLVVWLADRVFGDSYVSAIQSQQWRASPMCGVASGSVLYFSLVMPFLFSFLSLARYRLVKYPFEYHFKSLKFVLRNLLTIVTVSLSFSFGIVLSVMLKGSMPTGLCLPFADPTHSLWESKFVTCFIAAVQLTAICMIVSLSCLMLRKMSQSEQLKEMQLRKATLQLFLLIGSNVICWIPSSLIFLTSLLVEQYPGQLLLWTTAAVMPINSVINPLIFLTFLSSD